MRILVVTGLHLGHANIRNACLTIVVDQDIRWPEVAVNQFVLKSHACQTSISRGTDTKLVSPSAGIACPKPLPGPLG